MNNEKSTDNNTRQLEGTVRSGRMSAGQTTTKEPNTEYKPSTPLSTNSQQTYDKATSTSEDDIGQGWRKEDKKSAIMDKRYSIAEHLETENDADNRFDSYASVDRGVSTSPELFDGNGPDRNDVDSRQEGGIFNLTAFRDNADGQSEGYSVPSDLPSLLPNVENEKQRARLGSPHLRAETSDRQQEVTFDERDEEISDIESDSDDSSLFYDTDLEAEEPEVDRDINGLQRYTNSCIGLRVPPATPVMRNITTPSLDIPYYGLGERGSVALAVPLEVNTTVSTLNLKENCLGEKGAMKLAMVIKENSFLRDVNLSDNKLGKQGAILMCQGLRNHNYVRNVNLSNVGFTDKEASAVAEVIENNTKLRELDLSHNEFGTEAGIVLGQSLASNDTLEVLNLSWNHFRLRGACTISEGVAVNDGLKKLHLSMNGFANQGTLTMAMALTLNSTLEELDLSCNRIPSTTVADFSQCLEKNSTLKILKLGCNPILYKGAIGLVEAINKNDASKLEFLDLKDVVVLKDFMEIADEIKEKRKFQVVTGSVSGVKGLEKQMDRFGDKNPLEILLIFMQEQGMRLTDLFRTFDKDQSMSLSREEFIEGLKSVNTPLSQAQLEELIDMLDKDGDGEVDLKEILNINVEFKDIKRKAYEETKKVKEEKKQKKPLPAMQAIAKLMQKKNDKKLLGDDTEFENQADREKALMRSAAGLWKKPKENAQSVAN
ncbi:leucine-rich repeat-containing protein 74A [Lingula anatina]|uniref:Leucine-rich repeat-containing protein 74A n=1 Tax=Lingula anatina TaxID=7574 RepID=A0A1S3JT27_LINAN|nr:leucine-rich repeat-containing protein 74A [Lingula anatina]|eukprot:XP_013413482.1 leucine-rich repeat-containing protein 74A [Lingula anatina]